MLALYRAALALRHAHPGLAGEAFRWMPAPAGVLAFERDAGFACIVNISRRAVPLPTGSWCSSGATPAPRPAPRSRRCRGLARARRRRAQARADALIGATVRSPNGRAAPPIRSPRALRGTSGSGSGAPPASDPSATNRVGDGRAAVARPGRALTDRPLIPIIPLGISAAPRPWSPRRSRTTRNPRSGGPPAANGALMTSTRDLVQDERDQFAFHDDIVYLRETKRGLTRDTVEEISRFKDEPDWMLQFRLRAYDHFLQAHDARLGRRPRARSTSTRSSTTASRPSARRSPGTTSRSRSSRRSRSWASRRRSASSSPASAPSTTPRSSTTPSARSSARSAWSSWAPTRR